ncbi:MAG TPA: serine/threonine-protein kinase, partial [Planctomycetota bacterium]|nr:serine/threonine-protein kinase [Planctomycetota bacterium]
MVAADPASFRSGPLAGRFEVLQQFSGGEGTTALVREQRTGEQLVLKVLDPEVAPAEGALLSSLRHPAIPAVREVGRLGDGRAFLVRDYAPGRPLAELLPLPPERALDLARQVLAVLAFVHLRGVLHLDLKPQNLVVGDDGAVRLLDFGLGVRQGASSRGGTPFFAAPELLVGGTPDARSDLFSLGAVLVAALWPKPGKLPLARFLHQFPAQSFWIAADVEPAQFPAPFADFLPRCVARRPQRRFADAQAALEFLAGGTGRPALDLLRPDPITVFADALAAQVPGDDDVTLVGGAAADRQALALHFLCTLPGARSVAVTGESVRVVRLGGSSAPLRLPAISVPLLRPHLEQALGLQGAAATKAAELLLAGGERTAAAIGDRLVALAENGAVLPDGTRWLWPDAVAGRLGAVPDRAVAPTTASVLAAATAGQVELAFALWRRGAGDGDERALRTALVRGVLAAGDPARALPLCHDLPVERVQALFDLGQVAAATAALDGARAAAAATADGTRRLRRTEGQILTARGEHGPAIALLRALCAHDPRPEELQTLAAALETAGQAAESRELLQSLLPRFDAAAAPYLRAAVLTSMAHAERRLGAPERALADFQEARDLMFKVGHARHAATATHNLGVLAKDRGAMVEAVAHLRQARSLFQHVR